MADEAGTLRAGAAAAATTNATTSSRDYEVFLNFRGPDSRRTVVDVIHDALVRAGVRVFYDDESIRHGEVIEGKLMEAIINAKIYIPIFSKNYASSKWCLRELELILQYCKASQLRGEKRTILPIYYDVDVSTDLKFKSGLYATALQKHKDEFDEDVVKRWEMALQMASVIKGRDIQEFGLIELTKLIVEEICCKLWITSDPGMVPENYVAIDGAMEDIMKLLDLDAQDVRFVTIYGMGGVGKSTLARLVFNKVSFGFGQRVAFLSDIREKSRTNGGIVELQGDLLRQLLNVRSLSFLRDADDGINMLKGKLQDKKVLIILDDLEKSDQLMKLADRPSWFGMGSRIIITTRNIGIVPEREGFYRYKMQEMKNDDALKLFSRRVFDNNSPPEEYDEISREIVGTTGGLPLAISVIAPIFKNSSVDAWEGTLKKLKNVVCKDVKDKLMISYNQLDNYEKEIFLDIACLFINKEIEDATYYWEAQECYPISGITVLKNMSLIEIVDGKWLWMHDLLRDLGRNLVDEEFRKSGKCRRLWSPEVALNVVRRKKGVEGVQALRLGKLDANHKFNHKDFSGIVNLKFLELNSGWFENEDFKEVFSELRWLSWNDCPSEFQATNLCLENLVVLTLSENLITDDWGGWGEIKAAKNLKVLKCTYCRFLVKAPDFSAFPKLERLIFKNCAMLRELDPSIVKLGHLTYLEITNPLIYTERLPDEYISYHLEEKGPQILPDSICRLWSLSMLKLKFVNLSELPDAIGYLRNLKYLCIWCPQVEKLPDSIGNLKLLVELDISFTAITNLPESVTTLRRLKVFKYENCPLGEDATRIEELISLNQSKPIKVGRPIPSPPFDSVSLERLLSRLLGPTSTETERTESLKNM